MRETRVNLKNLLKDIRDGYGYPIEEAIIVELVANSLDSGASRIDFWLFPEKNLLTVCDNGQGMDRKTIKDYHNLAATTKARGKGIGFAGIGAKLSLLVAKVITETKGSYGSHCATQWYLMDEYRAPWKFIPSQGKVPTPRGTAVTLEFFDSRPLLLSADFISKTIKKHYLPLLHPKFLNSILKYFYKKGVNFFINGERVSLPDSQIGEVSKTFRVIIGKKRKRLVGFGYLAKFPQELNPELSGIGISTYGKVIKRGWDWLGILPKSGFQIQGMVEVPALSEILTTYKNDFLKDTTSLKKYYRYRKAIQGAILPILDEFGEERISFETDFRRLKPLEKEIERALGYLLNDFPELVPLLGIRRRKAKVRIPFREELPLVEIIQTGLVEVEKELPEKEVKKARAPKKEKEARKERSGLKIAFEKNPSQSELARLIKSTILINTNHPAYLRSQKENLEEYHILLCVAWILSRFIEEKKSPQDFINKFLSSWGYEYKEVLRLFPSTA